ncbi:MAG: metallophosphoesterase [candidate division FCPU426 bacterium]
MNPTLMRRIAHLSDLHFGTEVPEVVEALAHDLLRVKPDLLLVSGDLTQRARKSQFARAAEFLNRFPAPKLVVPGNHDVPLFNLYRRFINPLAAYHSYFPKDAESDFKDKEMLVLGLNSTRRFRWRRGQLSERQLEQMQKFFCGRSDQRFRIFMSHHPFMPHPRHFPRDLVFHRKAAVEILSGCRVDLVLVGHTHRLLVDNLQEFYPWLERPMVMAQAGTAISRRTFSRPHSYNVIRLKAKHFLIETRVFRGGRFTPSQIHVFSRAHRRCSG